MITAMATMYSQDDERISDPESPVNLPKKTVLVTPRPSSPREFFARIYGHLESEKSKTNFPVDKNVDENQDELLTDSSSDIDMNDGSLQMLPNIYESNSNENTSRYVNENSGKADSSSATAALVQLAAGSVPMTAGSSGINRFSGLPGLSGLQNIPGFLPPRPPFLFSGDLPFPTGFSAFLSRRRRGPGRSRRQRTTFSAAQTLRLEVEFRRAEYVGRPRRLELAASLRLSETQVKIWFQNRRAKDKRIEKAHLDHHYRTLAGLQPEYYSSFTSGTCGICLYKRESPCSHFLQQNIRSQGSTTPVAQCSEKFIQHSDILTN